MARRPTKVIVKDGRVLLRSRTGYHNPIGSIRQTASGVQACVRTAGGTPWCKEFKSVSRAVLHVVRNWQSWVGVGRGRTNIY